eukprot:c28171_g1_i6 orf=307-1956(+)
MERHLSGDLEARLVRDEVWESDSWKSSSGRALLFAVLAFLLLGGILTGLIVSSTDAKFQIRGQQVQSSRIAEADHGVVVADDKRCSLIGINVLREGGHAVDAAVATALCIGVVIPSSSGLGGGSFMLVRLANGEAETFDMRETAPAAATEDMYANNPSSKERGYLSVGVPGELAGLHLAWMKYGKLPWKRLFQPAISLAEKGFKVSPYLAELIQSSAADIKADRGLQQVFAPQGRLLQSGDLCFRKTLSKTLSSISEFGPGIFYNGSIGENIVAELRAAGGMITVQDLQDYRVEIRDPLIADVMGYTVLGMPPPSSGGVGLVLILNILASYGAPSALNGILGLHRTIEAFKHMFAVRMNLGDPDFVNVTDVVNDMLSPEFARSLQQTINDNMTFEPQYYGGRWNQIKDHGTSHLGVVDIERNAVAMTTTINYKFGAKILSLSTGIVLNNEMDDFSIPSDNSPDKLPPSATDFIRPNKRPLSSMSPTVILQNGQLRAVLGASGGMNIIPAVAQVFLNYFFKGMDPLSSVTNARVYHEVMVLFLSIKNLRV